jgi:choline dehydrogenase-like flavoprotein
MGFGTSADWNLITVPAKGIDNRQVAVSRGRFLGGCSGCNGTLAVRGMKADYDGWKLPGWSGEEMWAAMNKVRCHVERGWVGRN